MNKDKIKAIKIEQKQFIRVINDSNKEDSNITFGFILGAGASVTSGIPVANHFTKKWFPIIEEDLSKDIFKVWKQKTGILMQHHLSEFYTEIFEQRFKACKEVGERELQYFMDEATPGVGYSFFAQLLDQTKNKFVITTNFDTMTEDALFEFTKSKPLILVHELVSDYIDPTNMQRPTIIKIHRDFRYSPKNTRTETTNLADKWKKSLDIVLQNNAIIVIGYGGHDKSLMTYLQNIDSNERKSIYWCYREEDEIPKRAKELLTEKDFIVKIKGFDDLMITIGEKLQLDNFVDMNRIEDSRIVKNARSKAEKFAYRYRELFLSDELSTERKDILRKNLPSWFEYVEKAKNTSDIKKAESIYEDGMRKHPNNKLLMQYYIDFLDKRKLDIKKAKEFAEKLKSLPSDDLYTFGEDGYNSYSRYSVLDAKERVAVYLKDFGNQFFSTKNITIAKTLNITPETLSRCLKYFRDKGIIGNDMIDSKKLKDYLEAIKK